MKLFKYVSIALVALTCQQGYALENVILKNDAKVPIKIYIKTVNDKKLGRDYHFGAELQPGQEKNLYRYYDFIGTSHEDVQHMIEGLRVTYNNGSAYQVNLDMIIQGGIQQCQNGDVFVKILPEPGWTSPMARLSAKAPIEVYCVIQPK